MQGRFCLLSGDHSWLNHYEKHITDEETNKQTKQKTYQEFFAYDCNKYIQHPEYIEWESTKCVKIKGMAFYAEQIPFRTYQFSIKDTKF